MAIEAPLDHCQGLSRFARDFKAGACLRGVLEASRTQGHAQDSGSLLLGGWRLPTHTSGPRVATPAALAPDAVVVPWGAMPLSKEQKADMKQEDTKRVIQDQNPKKPSSKSWARFNQYKMAITIGDAMRAGANWQDLSSDRKRNRKTVEGTVEIVGSC